MAALATLALGIAANTAVFSLVYAALLRPLPYKNADQLAVLWASVPEKGIPADWTSWPTIQDWRKQTRSFEDIATELRIDSATLSGRHEPEEIEPEQIKVGRVSANLFPLLGVRPRLGRTYSSEEEAHREPLVVISSKLWHSRFGSSPSAIGQQLEIDHKRATVVGVMPESFAFPSTDTQLWLPLSFVPQWYRFLTARQSDGFRAVARLKPGVSFKQAQSEMNGIAHELGKQYPDTDGGKGIAIVPLAKQMVAARTRTSLQMLLGAVALVLLIGCGNVAGLLLARGTIRRREFAICAALGASRFRIVRQLMGESSALTGISSLLGWAITIVLLDALPRLVPPDFVRFAQAGMSLPVLLFTLGLSVVTGILFGILPAWQLASAEPLSALQGDSRTQAGQRSHSRMRSVLVMGEFAFAVILLSGAGLLLRSLILLQSEHLGFAPANLLMATVHLSLDESTQAKFGRTPFEDILEKVRSMPGIADAAVTGALFSNYTPNTDVFTDESSRRVQTAPSTLEIVSETFFRTMKIPLLRGRPFSEYDGPSRPAVAVINKTMANQAWPRQDAIGKRFRYGSPGEASSEWLTVIGIAGDMNPDGPGSKAIASFFRPYRQTPWPASMDIVVRYNNGNPAQLETGLRQSIRSVNREIPHFAIQTVPSVLAEMSAPRRFETWLVGLFAMAALCLASVGIYGLLHYLVAQRTQEIGLRIALGATSNDVFRLIVFSGMKLAAFGIVFGLGASFFFLRLVRHLLFGVSTNDPSTVIFVSLTLLAAALAASYFPARKAMGLDPMRSLRRE